MLICHTGEAGFVLLTLRHFILSILCMSITLQARTQLRWFTVGICRGVVPIFWGCTNLYQNSVLIETVQPNIFLFSSEKAEII